MRRLIDIFFSRSVSVDTVRDKKCQTVAHKCGRASLGWQSPIHTICNVLYAISLHKAFHKKEGQIFMVKVTTLKTQDGRKMLAIGLVVGMLVAAPLGLQAYANEDNTNQPAEQTAPAETTEPAETTTPADVEEPADPAPVDTTPVIQTPEPTEVPTEPNETDTTTQPTVADLQAAIGIAAPEHPGVEVVSAKVKRLGAETVYKVVFADGWVVYVSADDGEVLVVKDKHGKKHACHNYARAAWVKKNRHWDPWGNNWRAWASVWVRQQQWAAAQQNWQSEPQQEQQQQVQSNQQVRPWKHNDKQSTKSWKQTKKQKQQRTQTPDATQQPTETQSQGNVSHRSHNGWNQQKPRH